jgi:hypothetical protein
LEGFGIQVGEKARAHVRQGGQIHVGVAMLGAMNAADLRPELRALKGHGSGSFVHHRRAESCLYRFV